MTVSDLNSPYDGNGKSPAEIERDIAATRAGLGEVLNAIERRMTPRHLLEQGMDRLLDSMDGSAAGIGDALRGNPLPLALIGAGVGWLLLAGTGSAAPSCSAADREPGGVSHPLALGAVGVVAGAALAMLLPRRR